MTHDEQRQRRLHIANSVRGGMTPADACRQFGVSRGCVADSCREHSVVRRRIQRRSPISIEILERVSLGESAAEIATIVGCSPIYVQHVASAHDMFVSLAKYKDGTSFKIIAMLQVGNRQVDIAATFGFSRQAVNQIQKRAEKAGIKFPSDAG